MNKLFLMIYLIFTAFISRKYASLSQTGS